MAPDFGALRGKYLRLMPDGVINYLLIAESPPNQRSETPIFFYYDGEDCEGLGGLLENTMAALYPDSLKEAIASSKSSSDIKKTFLKDFSEDGFYVIDETDQILSGLRKSKKLEVLNRVRDSGSLLKQIDALARHGYVTSRTRIVLISALGYDVFFEYLKGGSVQTRSGALRLSGLMVDMRTPLPYRGNEGAYIQAIRSLKGSPVTTVGPKPLKPAQAPPPRITASPPPSRKTIEVRPPIDRIVVDGSNVSCYRSEEGVPDFSQLFSVYRQLSSKGFNHIKVFLGPSMRHRGAPGTYDWLLMKFRTDEKRKKKQILHPTPGGASDDLFIINFAIENDYLILTDDLFRDHIGARPGMAKEIKRRRVQYMIVDGELSITEFPAY